MKKENGITLVTLVIGIIILLILAGIATTAGLDSIRTAKKTSMITELEMIQEKVNTIYEKRKLNQNDVTYYNSLGQDISVVNSNIITQILGQIPKEGYRYFSTENLKQLDLDNISQDVIINFDTRDVASIIGIVIDGETYYRLTDMPDYSGQKIEQVDKNNQSLTFDIEVNKLSNSWQMLIKNIVNPNQVYGGTLSYKPHESENWILLGETTHFEVTISGLYDIKYMDKAGNVAIKQVPVPEAVVLKVGDYIKYDTGITTVGDNGVVMFRVLYPMASKYGLQIISNKNVQNLTLGGNDWETAKASYNGAIKKLNEESEKYINNQYAYDARCVGSIPTVKEGIFVNKNEMRNSSGYLVNTVSLPPSKWTSYTRPTGWTSNDTGCYDEDSNYITDFEALGTTMRKTDQEYWLASLVTEINTSRIRFNVRSINTSGDLYSGDVGYIHSGGGAQGVQGYSTLYGLRVCISLKSDVIKIIDGDGTEKNPYIIGK